MTTTSSTSSSSTTTGSSVIQSLGIGSGLDISSLVSQLTTAEMSADNNRVTREQTDVTTQVSALGTLKAALSTFQASISGMTDLSTFDARAATSGDDTVFTATATSAAPVGNYDITVKQLAQGQQLLSNNFTGGSTAVVGTGTLSVSLGTSTFSVTIDSSDNTLAGIRDAINNAADNQGVSATLVYGTSGAQLLLTSSKTGAANTVAVNQTGGDGGLSALVYNSTTTGNYTVKQDAQDSIVSVAGVDHQSSANTVSGAIDGITLTLLKAQKDTPVALTISDDTSHVTSMVQAFVTAYNTLVSSMAPLGSYDASTQTAGPMLGDALLNGIQNQLSRALITPVASAGSSFNSLASLGVTKNVDGTLTLDSSKLTTAMNTNFKAVAQVLGGKDGVLNNLNNLLDSQLSSAGSLTARNTTLTDQQTQITNEKDAITQRTAVVQARYLAQFNAMDTLLASLQNTSTYLTQQFNALNKSSN